MTRARKRVNVSARTPDGRRARRERALTHTASDRADHRHRLGRRHVVPPQRPHLDATAEAGVELRRVVGAGIEDVHALTERGIPVMAHVGLRPQNVHVDGGYVVQRDQEKLVHDAVIAEQAGAFAVLIECVPAAIADQITRSLSVPTIGIGAGASTSGQVLVTNDLIGLTSGYLPRFVTQLADVQQVVTDAVVAYRDAVRDGSFPTSQHEF